MMKIIVLPVQSCRTQNELSGNPLMFEIMQRIADTRMGHAEILIHLEQEYWHDPCLPVVAVNDVGMLAGLKHEFKGRPAEKYKPLRVIIVTVEPPPVKKMSVRMGLDKKTFAAVDKSEEDGTMHVMLIKRHPEVIIYLLKPVNMVIPHAVVFGKYDFDIMPSYLHLTAEPVDHIRKTSNFGYRCTFGCYLDYKHSSVYRKYILHISIVITF
jgi:hypothetical protein